MLRSALPAAVLLLVGCNDYDTFRIAGFQQDSFSNQADVLFVIDNSGSMTEEAAGVVANLGAFVQDLADPNFVAPPDPDLSNDVERFVEYVTDRTSNINYQLAVTTTDAASRWGDLLGTPSVIAKTDSDVAAKFTKNFLCEAACFESLDTETRQLWNQLCDQPASTADQNCEGSGIEEGIESVFMTMCRSFEDPPEACFDDWYAEYSDEGGILLGFTDEPPDEAATPLDYFRNRDALSTNGFIRDNSTVIPVIITDEGDSSRRGLFGDGRSVPYDELFAQFPNRMSWAIIGPGAGCGGPSSWGTDRYRTLVAETNGVWIDISTPNEAGTECVTPDFGQALGELGNLLKALSDTFPLQALPQDGTITVEVDGQVVHESEQSLDEDLGISTYTDGWSYRSSDNVVVLHGTAVPEFNADVSIYYLPAEGVPRQLPF